MSALMQLRAENWHDLFGFIPRRALANQVSFVNNYFCSVAHVRLHEQGQFVLGPLHFDSATVNGQEKAILWCNNRKVPFPEQDAQMPENIVNFEEIVLSHLDDAEVMGMLQKMRPLLESNADISIWLDYDEDDDVGLARAPVWHKLRWLMPMLIAGNGRKALVTPELCTIGEVAFAPLLGQLKTLYFEEFLNIQPPLMELLSNWLHSAIGPNEGDFRMLCCIVSNSVMAKLIREIEQKFRAAERTATFFVRVKTISDMEVVNSVQNNTQTGERLTVEKVGSILMISRHLDNAGSVWLAARKEEALGWQFTKQKRRLVLRQKF